MLCFAWREGLAGGHDPNTVPVITSTRHVKATCLLLCGNYVNGITFRQQSVDSDCRNVAVPSSYAVSHLALKVPPTTTAGTPQAFRAPNHDSLADILCKNFYDFPRVPTLGKYLQPPKPIFFPRIKQLFCHLKLSSCYQRRYTNLSVLDGEHITGARLHIAEHVL